MNFRELTCFVSVIISYSSNEKVTIIPILSQSSKFSDDIVVSFGSRLLNGSAEDKGHIATLSRSFPTVQFAEYQIDFSLNLSNQAGVQSRPKAYWHNLARWTGARKLRRKQWVFVLDADEVPDGRLVRKWIHRAYAGLTAATCYKMASFWYFKKPTFQATTLEDAPLLIHYNHLTRANIFGDSEREHLVTHSQCDVQHFFKDKEGQILWHHYSWVRSKSAMTQKMKHWGHADDRFKDINVETTVEEVFKDKNVNDFVHQYQYRQVNNVFGIQV